MFQKVFEYAGPHKKGLYAATAIVLVSVLMGVLPFVLAYQVIAPLVMGESIGASFIISRVALVLACLVLQALFYGWGLNLSHKAAYDTLLRLRTALQKRFEKLPLGVIQDKGTGTVKKLFVDDVDSLEVLLAHSMPEGIANLMIPIAVYVAMFFVDWKLALLSLASIPISLIAMMTMYSVGMKKMGPYYMAGQKMNNTIIEYINGMEVVKVFNKDADSYERFRKDVSDYRDYTLAWYKAAWPWMAIYSSLLPCTIILTLPVGAWFVLSGWSTLFINIKGDTIGKPLRVDSVYDMFERMEKKTGIKITPHMLRRYYANTRWEADWPLEMISQALGHKHLDTTIRYLNVLDDKLKTASQEFYRRYSKLYGVEQFLESRR